MPIRDKRRGSGGGSPPVGPGQSPVVTSRTRKPTGTKPTTTGAIVSVDTTF